MHDGEPGPDILELLFTLPADARLLPLTELSPRIRATLGCTGSGEGQVAVSRPGFRVTTRLISPHLAALLQEFRQPSRLPMPCCGSAGRIRVTLSKRWTMRSMRYAFS